MVTKAMFDWPAIRDQANYRVYAKGSYANNTNIRLDSDVDIAVQNQNCLYYEYSHCDPLPGADTVKYTGDWTPEAWRREVLAALRAAFPREVSGSGTVAITIDEHDGTRPDIDVVPSFNFVRYHSADQSHSSTGSKVFLTSGAPITNFPDQQLQNGRTKNVQTNGAYKKYARALKSAENQLVKDGTIKAKPSYFMECLAFNVPDHVLSSGATLDAGFKATLIWLWTNLTDDNFVHEKWLEPNKLKYLFRSDAKWDRADAKELVLATWGYLGYTNA